MESENGKNENELTVNDELMNINKIINQNELLNINNSIAASSVERDVELHNLDIYLKEYQENSNKLQTIVKELESKYEKRVLENNYLEQNLQLVEENLQLWKTSAAEMEEKEELLMDNQRLQNKIDKENVEKANHIHKRLQNALKCKVDCLELKPQAQKRRELKIQNEKMKIKVESVQQSIMDEKEKNTTMRNIIKRQEQIKMINFARIMVENKKNQELKFERKIPKSTKENQINEKKVLNVAKEPKEKIVAFEDTYTSDELIDVTKYEFELSDLSKRLQKLSAKRNSPITSEQHNFAIPEMGSSFSEIGNKLLNSLKRKQVAAMEVSENQINSSEDDPPSIDASKFNSQLLELSKQRQELSKKYSLQKKAIFTPFSSSESNKTPKYTSLSSINVLSQPKRIAQNLPNQLTSQIKKYKMDSSQENQSSQNKKENITKNLSQNTQKTFPKKQLNLPSIQSQNILQINKTSQKPNIKNLSQSSNPSLSPAKTNQLPQPKSNPQVVSSTSKENSQKQVEHDVEIPVIKSSYFPTQTDDCNLNNSTSDKASSQLVPSNYSTQDSEKFRLSSDFENHQSSGQPLSVVEEYGDVNMGNNKNLHIIDENIMYDLEDNDIEIEMPNFSPYVSPTLPNIVNDKKEENTSNGNNNDGFVFSFGQSQKSSSFFNMF